MNVLVVEDSKAFSKVLCIEIAKKGFEPHPAYSRQEALELINKHHFFAALVDLGLPDATDGEVVDDALNANIPTIVLTGMFDKKTREMMEIKPIVDFVLKQGVEDIYYAISILDRIKKNRKNRILIVDDSTVARALIKDYLQTQLYSISEAKDGVEALAVMADHKDIKLVITDYNMPNMDGFELTRRLRKIYDKDSLGIIAVSSSNMSDISSRFFKNGANDYLKKPFSKEELISRTNLNISMIEAIEEQKKANAKIEKLNKALIKEQKLARVKQLGTIVNDFEDDERFLIKEFYQPSEILSGDAYSLHKTPDGSVLIYMVDGMGHGLLPSFTTFAISSTIKQSLPWMKSFDQLLIRIGESLRGTLSDEEQLSFTFIYIPCSFDSIEFAIGGMYPSYIKANGDMFELKANNPPFMSFMPDIKASKIDIKDFKKLIIYSDGLTEDSKLGFGADEVTLLLEDGTFEWVTEKISSIKTEDDTTILYFEKLGDVV